ncbi:MAG TPA: hypothetical protein VF695_03320 [Sphingomonas sp.]|jgi:hypothetical protein
MGLVTAGTAACAKCKFFDTDAHASASLGLCRYNPPISQPSNDQAGVWPKVAASDWCGHFEAALTA